MKTLRILALTKKAQDLLRQEYKEDMGFAQTLKMNAVGIILDYQPSIVTFTFKNLGMQMMLNEGNFRPFIEDFMKNNNAIPDIDYKVEVE